MKTIEIDDNLYQYIAGNTKFIGESASQILRRLLAQEEHDIDSVDTIETGNVAVNVDKSIEQPLIDNSKKSAELADEPNFVEPEVQIITAKVTQESENKQQNIFDFINKEELAMQRGAVGRFLLILANLHRVHPNQFFSVLDIRGRDRLYFADSEKALLANGSSTKPKQIPESPYWVITNSNTTKKKLMLTDVAHVLGYSSNDVEKIRDFL